MIRQSSQVRRSHRLQHLFPECFHTASGHCCRWHVGPSQSKKGVELSFVLEAFVSGVHQHSTILIPHFVKRMHAEPPSDCGGKSMAVSEQRLDVCITENFVEYFRQFFIVLDNAD